MTIEQIQARLAEINTALETAEGEAFTTLEAEARGLLDQLNDARATAASRQELRSQIASGLTGSPAAPTTPAQQTTEERAAAAFRNSGRMRVDAEQARAVTVAGGKLVQPTKTSGINDLPGVKVSSIIDLVTVENCVGMGSDEVALITEDMSEAADQTEGQTVAASEPTFSSVKITPSSHMVLSYITKQAKKLTNLAYAEKVKGQALLALRKKCAKLVTTALKASKLHSVLNGKLDTNKKGVVDETTLRTIALAYGGDEGVDGAAWLFLTKADLQAFGAVRGTQDKKAVYTITPDGSNPNVGTIAEGGTVVKYCLNKNLDTFSGTAQAAEAKVTMLYGNPKAIKLDLFSDYEIKVSEDFAFDKLMDAIRGDFEAGSDVVQKHAFVAYTIPATA